MVRTNADYKYTSVAVDQVMAADGNYQVLFLGTGMNVDRPCKSFVMATTILSVGIDGGRSSQIYYSAQEQQYLVKILYYKSKSCKITRVLASKYTYGTKSNYKY